LKKGTTLVTEHIRRRDFVGLGAAAVALPPAAPPRTVLAPQPPKILNYNPNMEYRRLGKTGLMVSAVCLGGHWKRLNTVMPAGFKGEGYNTQDDKNVKDPVFLKNRSGVVTRCIELGINYVDACSPQEILAYSAVLQGRRDKMYFGFSWHTREPRYDEWRTADRLLEGFQMSLKEAKLDYVDLWRISLPMQGITDMGILNQIEEATVEALRRAKQRGLTRHTGVSSHNRQWLKYLVEHYPKEIEAVLFPYTADSKVLPDDSLFEALKKSDTGALGIKPFADNSLFAGNSSPSSPHFEEDNRRARLAIRYVLENPAITAPIPGLITTQQVDNVAQAIAERRREGRLSRQQRSELERATRGMWARLRPGYEWLRDWENV
jgi:aryl-alcohol dehydrogenase-like predicted oxidoreductase